MTPLPPAVSPNSEASPVDTTPSIEFTSNLGAAVGLFYGLLETLFGIGALAVSGILISRTVGKSEFGVWSTVSLLMGTLVILTSLRAEVTLAQLIGRARGLSSHQSWRMFVRPALSFSVAISVGATLVLIAIRWVAPMSAETRHLMDNLAVMGLALVPMSVTLVLNGVLRGLERMRQAAIARSMPYVIWLLVAVVLALMEASLGMFVAAFVMTFFLMAIYLVVRYRDLVTSAADQLDELEPSLQGTRAFIASGVPLTIALLFGRGSTQLSNYMVAFWLGNAAAGAFNAGFNVAAILQTGMLSLMGIFVPMVARLVATGDMIMAERVYQRATRWLFVPMLALSASAIVYAPAVMGVYGASFATHAPAFRVLVVAFMLDVSLGPNRAFLVALGRNRLILNVNILGVTVSLVANVLLIPPFGVYGAAISTLLGMLFSNLYAAFYLWRRFDCQPFTWRYFKLMAFGIMGAGLLAALLLPVLGGSLLAGMIYGGAYSMLLGLWVWKSDFVDEDDLELRTWIIQRLGWQRA